MLTLSYTPQPPLSHFIDQLWFYHGYTLPHALERIMPTGKTNLIINLDEDEARVYEGPDAARCEKFRGTVVCGPYSESCVKDTAEQQSTMGVDFKAGGAGPFLRVPAGELHGTHVSLETLWGPRAGELREQLLYAQTPEAKFHVLERALLNQAADRFARHPAVAFAVRRFEQASSATIAEVADSVGLSARRFIQVFRDEVGLTPKLFCRVTRFQQVLHQVNAGKPVNWAGLAATCGYFDQAHFIRDFRSFSGLNPSAYLAQRGDYANHVPLAV